MRAIRFFATTVCVAYLFLGFPAPIRAQGPDLTGTKWRMTGDPLKRTFIFLQCKSGSPVKFTDEPNDSTKDVYPTAESRYQRYGYDGTYDGKRLVLKGRSANELRNESLILSLTLSSDGSRLSGSETHNYGGGIGADTVNTEFVREGGASTSRTITSPAELGSYLKKIIGLILMGLMLLLVLRQLGKKNKGEEKKETDYLLYVRTVDERTTLSADGQDILWIYGAIVSDNPAVDTVALTSTLTFIPQGPNASWLILDGVNQQVVEGFKVASVRAWPPAATTQLMAGGPVVMVTTMIEGNLLSGPVTLEIQDVAQYELEIF